MSKPFVYGMSVEGENFTDREVETKRLVLNFENGINSILISPRRMGKTSLVNILSVLFTMLPVFLFAQNSSLEYESNLKLDIRASEFSSMNLTKNQEDIPLLVVFDYQPVEKDDLSLMDFSNPSQFSAKNLAAIVGTKPRHVKAYRILKGEDATQIWGIRGVNGVLEILSPSKYRQWTQNGYQENFNLVKGR